MSHLKEPWVLYMGNLRPKPFNVKIVEIQDNNGKAIINWQGFDGQKDAAANAKRAVACVNACSGLKDPESQIKALVRIASIICDRIDQDKKVTTYFLRKSLQPFLEREKNG